MSDSENGNFKRTNNVELKKEPKIEHQESTEPEKLRKLFIGGLSYETNDDNLKEYFEQWGTVVDVVVMRETKSRRSRGFGFITYSHSHMVDSAQRARPHKIDGRTVEPKRAVPRHDIDNPSAGATVTKLFVGGLRNEHDEETLREYFSSFGQITRVTLVSDKDTGKFRGFAFVEFSDYDPVDKIILHKNHTLLGVKINVKKAIPKDQMDRLNNGRFDNRGNLQSNDCHSNDRYDSRGNQQNHGTWLTGRQSTNNNSWNLASGSNSWNPNNYSATSNIPLGWNNGNNYTTGNSSFGLNNDMNINNGNNSSNGGEGSATNRWVGNNANNYQLGFSGGPQRNPALGNNRNAPYSYSSRCGNNYTSVDNYGNRNN